LGSRSVPHFSFSIVTHVAGQLKNGWRGCTQHNHVWYSVEHGNKRLMFFSSGSFGQSVPKMPISTGSNVLTEEAGCSHPCVLFGRCENCTTQMKRELYRKERKIRRRVLALQVFPDTAPSTMRRIISLPLRRLPTLDNSSLKQLDFKPQVVAKRGGS
jgi:hypothetical protein